MDAYTLNLFAKILLGFFAILIFIGVILKLYSILIATLAFPTYLGLYILEDKFGLKFSIARINPYKGWMNHFAALSTVIVAISFWRILPKNFEYVESALDTDAYYLLAATVLIVSIASIYFISYKYAEKDESDFWTKVENLSIPSLWRGVFLKE